MVQRTSPFVEGKYGWDFGESGWNSGMDENLLKFSFLFDRNIDGIVDTLPTPIVDGKAYFLTADNRLYFSVNSQWYSSPTPKWFVLTEKVTGSTYRFDGISLSSVPNNQELSNSVDSIELTLASLGNAAFEDVAYFASRAELDVAEASAAGYTDSLRADIASLEVGDDGSELVGYIVNDLNASARNLHTKMQDFAVNVEDFYKAEDGDDYTPAAVRANAFSLSLAFPPKEVKLQNWEPLAGTTIFAIGSTINRLNDTGYGGTPSCAAIIAKNDDVVIFGGEFGLSNTATNTVSFTGSILTQSGSLRCIGSKFTQTWGGICGMEFQNGSLSMENLSLESCTFDGCFHNTYIADVKNLNIVGCESKNSNRDGIRLYRNVENFLIVGNHIHDNGDGAAAQSQDAIDIFYGGKRGIISNNFLYNNVSQGLDIKRSPTPQPESVFSNYVVITGNHIYGNGFSGISMFMGLDPAEYNLSYLIANNHIHNNTSYGVIGLYCKDLALNGNHVYENGATGIRLENCIGYSVANNHVYDNGRALTGGLRIGIHTLGTCSEGSVTENNVHPNGLTNQQSGIWFFGTGRCYNNNSRGHSSEDYNCDSNLTQKGKTYLTKFGNNTTTQLLAIASKGCFAGVRLLVNNSLTADVIVQKRNPSTGSSPVTLATQTGFSNPTAYTSSTVASTATTSVRNVVGGEALTLTLLNITSGFTEGVIEVHYID